MALTATVHDRLFHRCANRSMMTAASGRVRSVGLWRWSRSIDTVGHLAEEVVHITLGSNIYHDTNGVINAEGLEQIRLELDGSDIVILTLSCFDVTGQRTAYLVQNDWVQNDDSSLAIESVLGGVRVERSARGEVVLEVRATTSDSVEIVEGSLRTHTGRLLEITPDYWRIGDKTMGGFVFNCQGAAVSIS